MNNLVEKPQPSNLQVAFLNNSRLHLDEALREYSNLAHFERQSAIKALISAALEMKKSNGLSDDDFVELLSVVLSRFVENQVEYSVMPKIHDKIAKLMLLGIR